ncbi:hypothetical protein BW687_019350 [Pseudomonas graminis]|uniref:hypothetical protein n=1 Tax=Pseudomonas graminis TaxID=158627 RepID=UPI002349631A|nr:hypothetical protein [Pseudomonas graminis]MDC6382324.1 hypothetical protein [Pseudomonas graminis]
MPEIQGLAFLAPANLSQICGIKQPSPLKRPTHPQKSRFNVTLKGQAQKIAPFDGSAPAQVTKAWGIMPLYRNASVTPCHRAFLVARSPCEGIHPLFISAFAAVGFIE